MKIMKYAAWGLSALFAVQAATAAPMPELVDTQYPEVFEKAGPQERMKAVGAAKILAQRNLLERIKGLQLDAKTCVYDLIMQDDTINASLNQTIVGAGFDDPVYRDDGRVEVVAKVKMEQIISTLKNHILQKKIAGLPITVARLDELDITIKAKIVDALGESAIPGSVGEKRIQARRAAQLDAYRNLVARMMGMQITSKTKVKDYVLQSDKVTAALANVLQGAEEIAISYDPSDNSCKVKMQVRIADIYRVIELYVKGSEDVLKDRIETDISTFSEEGNGSPRPEGFVADTGEEVADLRLTIRQYITSGIAF